VPTREDGGVECTVEAAVARAIALARRPGRRVIGIAGSPGAGKSTLARRVVAEVCAALGPGTAVQVPMDGFHLSNAALDALGRHDRKGAIDTFDADGYVALVRRLAVDAAPGAAMPDVWAPDFDRRVDEPVAGSILVPGDTRLVVSEGNYLLDDASPWTEIRALCTETWFCAVEGSVRTDRLVGRHMRHGRDHDAALAWATDVDGANAARVEPTGRWATLTVLT
jgi:pantothenate kinase